MTGWGVACGGGFEPRPGEVEPHPQRRLPVPYHVLHTPDKQVPPAPRMNSFIASRTVTSRLIGALFLAGFVVYGGGFALVTSVIGTPDYVSTLTARSSTLVLGACIMLLNTVVDVGKGVLFFPVLEKYGKRTALAYLSALLVQVVMLDLGVLALLMLVPLGQHVADGGAETLAWANSLASLLTHSNTTAYLVGQATLSVGGVLLCALLLATRLIPRVLATWGLIGYVIHLAGSIAEIFGIPVSLVFSAPGGLFELALGFWLLIRGFQPAAFEAAGAR